MYTKNLVAQLQNNPLLHSVFQGKLTNTQLVVYAICAALALVALVLFGRAVFHFFAELVKFAYKTIGAGARLIAGSMVALGWYMIALFVVAVVGTIWASYIYWFRPGDINLARYRPPVCSEIFDRNNEILDYTCPFDGVRIWRPLSKIDQSLRSLVVMLEDDKFFEHGGLDIEELWNSLEHDIEKKKLARGGSTITQQLAKNLFLTKEKSILRKATELPLAIRLENEFSKDQILELYLNTIEWGHGVFGAEAASRLYFDHEANELSTAETWMLALMIPNPKELNLWATPKGEASLLKRAKHLSVRLAQEHHMTKAEAHLAFEEFTRFLDAWKTKRPVGLRSGRKFPARWALQHTFELGDLAPIKQKASALLQRLSNEALRSNLDKTTQTSLENAMNLTLKLKEGANLIMLVDANEVRAIAPISSADEEDLGRLPQLKPLAESSGLKIKVSPARTIAPTALWR